MTTPETTTKNRVIYVLYPNTCLDGTLSAVRLLHGLGREILEQQGVTDMQPHEVWTQWEMYDEAGKSMEVQDCFDSTRVMLFAAKQGKSWMTQFLSATEIEMQRDTPEMYLLNFSIPFLTLMQLQKQVKTLHFLTNSASIERAYRNVNFPAHISMTAKTDNSVICAQMVETLFGLDKSQMVKVAADYILGAGTKDTNLVFYAAGMYHRLVTGKNLRIAYNQLVNQEQEIEAVFQFGKIIEELRGDQVDKYMGYVRLIKNIPVVNAPVWLTTNIMDKLLKEYKTVPFVLLYQDRKVQREWRVRSHYNTNQNNPAAIRSNIIAEFFGGAGHVNAAGFTTKLDLPPERLIAEIFLRLKKKKETSA